MELSLAGHVLAHQKRSCLGSLNLAIWSLLALVTFVDLFECNKNRAAAE